MQFILTTSMHIGYCNPLVYRLWLTLTVRESTLDVIIWRHMTHNIGIQMNQKELTKTFMMVSNWKNLFGSHGL